MRIEHISRLTILLVDDQPANTLLLRSMLERAGYSKLYETNDPCSVVEWVTRVAPDLIVLDLHMPVRDGFLVMQDLRAIIPPDEFLPILVITADATRETKRQALAQGANDFLSKPFDRTEVLLRIDNLLKTRAFDLRLRSQNQQLEDLVRERTREIEAAHLDTLERLALAAEYRDDSTGEHTRRVGRLSKCLASELAVPASRIALIERAAPLHDIGKIGVPDSILLKPGRLDPDEFKLMQTHTTIGARLLSSSSDPLLRMAETVALSHHERWDGAGYPQGLTGANIPVEGRIVAVADVFDALTHVRPYKAAWTMDAAMDELRVQAGRQFEPRIVEAFDRLWRDRRHPIWEQWPAQVI